MSPFPHPQGAARQRFLALGFAIFLTLGLNAQAVAAGSAIGSAPNGEPTKKGSAPKKKIANSKANNVQDSSSGETTRERERRLYRECKGQRNAGACLGFAS